ncbi:MAG: hypothetical protein LQ343_001443 [Gyalolechia ehrenbergii]|nr:MAG: hypothetical protein LQ343_001443 [Gyalolechia ehrenbergii]
MVELKGGKTAPVFLDDLDNYDPRRSSAAGFNRLINLPRQYKNGAIPLIPRYKAQCQHKWAAKDSQCRLPLILGRPDPKIVSTVTAFCELCRCHLDLSIDFRGGGTSPCPSEESPLHHFRHQPEISRPHYKPDTSSKANGSNDWQDLNWFQCSSIECSAKLKIQIKPPRLRPEWVELLTDKDLIKSRAEEQIIKDPARFEGHAVPLPSDVLSNLRTYILNALRDGTRRTIQANNKKWLLCLGDPCSELLGYIGFVREGENWLVPEPDVSQTPPISNPVNTRLEDVEKELLALLLKRPDDERRAIKVQYGLNAATRDLSKVLSTGDYKQNPSARTATSQDPEHPFYPSLGAKLDYHDDLIKFSYERQLVSDPEHTPYYLEALQGIAKGRKSEELQTLVAIEASSGKISTSDIREAYKLLDLEIESEFLDEDFIIGSFQSRAADAPRQDSELRRALQIVGQDRSSQKIQSMASKTLTNYEQALSWLGATPDMDDEFVVAMYKVKEEETPAEEATARQAVSLVAQHRNSAALKQWLDTGVLGEVDMDVGQAYNRLQIDDRSISDDFILSAFQLFHQEAPSRMDDLRSALRAIAKHRKSHTLLSFLDSGMATSEYPLGEWPVGLANIGNTCYLNSLLQFYFTMKPLRELVLEFDEYKMDLTVDNLVQKMVGSRKISRQEVQRAQSFVYGLQKLFQSMITSASFHVAPELELARLTLVTQPLEAALRRRSTTSGNRPSLGEINGRPVLGPMPPPIPEAVADNAKSQAKLAKTPMNGDGNGGRIGADTSSEETLLGNDPAEAAADQEMLDPRSEELQQQQQQILEDKENLPPSKMVSDRPATPDPNLQPLAESSPSRINEQHRAAETTHDLPHPHSPNKSEKAVIAPPPNRPPPFPPRPQTEEQKQAIVEEVQLGAQQDVTEVISNVLFQLECAIKATAFDPSGEQIDLIKQLFFGKQKSYTSNAQGVLRMKEQFFSNLIVDVASGPKDIYEALDGAFDEQEVEVEGSLRPQYTTITHLPPVLKVMVQRVQYDQKKASAFKSINHLGLKETIYMDRYMDSEDDDLIQRRKESWEWKRQLRQLETRKADLMQTELEMNMPDALTATKEYLDQLSEDDTFGVPAILRHGVENAAAEARDELSSIDARIKDLSSSISSQFVDLQNLPYRLQSVFIHVGSATFGHYWIYIRDFEKNMWRKYNDESVSAVTDVSQIFDQDPSDRPPTPYFLVYVKDELKDQLVNPVCRDVLPQQQPSPPPQQPQYDTSDAVMNDAGNDYPMTVTDAVEDGQGTTVAIGDWYKADNAGKQIEW